MCGHTSAPEDDDPVACAYLDGAARWEDRVLENTMCGRITATAPPTTLEECLIQGLGTQSKPRKVDRKVAGVFLASSLFHLCESPWLQHGLEGKNILVLPSSVSQPNLLRPHISCDFSSHPEPRSLHEDVAALGVLLLELEAERSAGWTADDEDYETGVKSNSARLIRILKKWEGDLAVRYRGVGSACFMFEKLVEDFDRTEIDQGLSKLAVLYKCIVNPLYRQLMSDFPETAHLFQGMPGLRIPVRENRASTTRRLVLFDDGESSERDTK